MRRRRTLPVTATLAVAATLTLTAAVLGRLGPEAPVDDAAAAGREVAVPALEDPVRSDPPGGDDRRAPVVATPSPVALHLPTLDVSAPLVPVGVLEGGVMEIPDDVATVGWYATAARRVSPGDPGTAVLAGHRDSRVQGSGALRDVGGLDVGDAITVAHLDGSISTWQVDEVLLTPP